MVLPPVLLLFFALLLSVDCSLPAYEKESLISLYNATGGTFWTDSTNWNVSTDPCTSLWFGVECGTLNETVKSLNLAENNLTGYLPDLQLPSLITM